MPEQATAVLAQMVQNDGYQQDMHRVFARFAMPFLCTFGVPLTRFWSDRDGFDTLAFDDRVVGSGQHRHICDVVRETYGEEGQHLLETLLAAEDAVFARYVPIARRTP